MQIDHQQLTAPIVLVHGGATEVTEDDHERGAFDRARGAVEEALRVGHGVLVGGGSAVDAVEAAVRVLESAPDLNAAVGAALDRDGTASCDASIMDGDGRRCGAVAGMRTVLHPVEVARMVMDRTD